MFNIPWTVLQQTTFPWPRLSHLVSLILRLLSILNISKQSSHTLCLHSQVTINGFLHPHLFFYNKLFATCYLLVNLQLQEPALTKSKIPSSCILSPHPHQLAAGCLAHIMILTPTNYLQQHSLCQLSPYIHQWHLGAMCWHEFQSVCERWLPDCNTVNISICHQTLQ